MASTSSLAVERAWWGDCRSTFHEEQKQLVYAARMGLVADWTTGHPPAFDLAGRSVVDIGGGPVSLLLKCANLGEALVVDPCEYPEWVLDRYEHCDIHFRPQKAEHLEEDGFDEAWIYNVLQHVEDPERVVRRARRAAATVRVFEWINVPAYDGHPHTLRAADLDRWLGAAGFTVTVNESGAVGDAYYGVFRSADSSANMRP